MMNMATRGEYNLKRGGDDTVDYLCVVCKGKNNRREAETFCIECHDYYCSCCVKYHDDIPVLKHHQILDKSSAPLPPVPTAKCTEHKYKPVDMYCENHNIVGCFYCMLVDHSTCKDKAYIPDFVEIFSKATDSSSVEKKLERIAKSLHELQEVLMEEKKDLKCNIEKVLKEIGTFRKKLNHLLDQFEKNIVEELEQRLKFLTDKIDSSLRDLQATTTDTKAAQDNLKSTGGNMPQKFVTIMQANQVVASAEAKVEIKERNFSQTEIYFLINKKLQILFSEIQDLGSINLRVREKLRITAGQKYPVNMISDSGTCYIISACTLKDGTIILADHDNSKLKRLYSSSKTHTVTDSCDVPQRPWQVCAISYKEVAVSCRDSKLIQVVYVVRTMKKTTQIKTSFHCQGLAYAERILYVSDKSSVYMVSLSGEQLHQLYNDQSEQGLFSSVIRALAINSEKSRIYVANNEKGLIILDMYGQLVAKYNGHKLRGAWSVYLDTNDNVLVGGRGSRNVLQFNSDGKLIGELLKTDGLCRTVCCSKNNKLIVGFEFTNSIGVNDINAE